jgi:hypothetical protein
MIPVTCMDDGEACVVQAGFYEELSQCIVFMSLVLTTIRSVKGHLS